MRRGRTLQDGPHASEQRRPPPLTGKFYSPNRHSAGVVNGVILEEEEEGEGEEGTGSAGIMNTMDTEEEEDKRKMVMDERRKMEENNKENNNRMNNGKCLCTIRVCQCLSL